MTRSVVIESEQFETVKLGEGNGLFLMAGPCVIEGRDICMRIAEHLVELTGKLGIGYLFKASFDKANRTSIHSYRGPGLAEGLQVLDEIRGAFKIPVVTDIHESIQAAACGEVVDVLQIPAFLARQTDLVVAAAQTGKCIQVKKAQFMAPWDMKNVVTKIVESGNERITLVERGSSFGYNRLICDMTSIPQMQALGWPVVIDATHSTQQPGGLGTASGGSPDLAKVLAQSAVAAGVDGIFLETHPNPTEALSDAATMLPLDELEELLKTCRDIYESVRR